MDPETEVTGYGYEEECRDYARLSEEQRYLAEMQDEAGSCDRYDGWKEDLSNEGWLDLEDEADVAVAAEPTEATPPQPAPAPFVPATDPDDILF